MRDIFQRWKTHRLRGHLVWIPMLNADDLDAAIAQEALFQDERISHYWDGERVLGRLVAQTLKLAARVARGNLEGWKAAHSGFLDAPTERAT